MNRQAAAPKRFLTAIDRSNTYSRAAVTALKRARGLSTWVVVVGVLGVMATSSVPGHAILFAVSVILSVLVRLRLPVALDNTLSARHQVHDLPDPVDYRPGELLTVRAHPSPLGISDEPLIVEVMSGDVHDGTARVVSEPFAGEVLVPHGAGAFIVRKDDVVKYHQKEGLSPGIWAKGDK